MPTPFESKVKSLIARKGKISASDFKKIGEKLGMGFAEMMTAKRAFLSATPKKRKTRTVKAKVEKINPPTTQEKRKYVKKSVNQNSRLGNLPPERDAKGNVIPPHGVVINDGNSFVWIASPEEIASKKDLHLVEY